MELLQIYSQQQQNINMLKDFKSILRLPALDLISVKTIWHFWCVSRKLEWWSTQRIINWTMDRQGICCSLFWQTKKIKRAVHPCRKGAQSTIKFLLSIHVGEYFRSPQQIHWYLWALDMFKCEKMSAFDKTGEGQETSYRYCRFNWKISSRRFEKKKSAVFCTKKNFA